MSDAPPVPTHATITPRHLDRFDRPPGDLTPPPPGEIHVWSIPLDPPEGDELRLRPLLHPDERARADRFRFPVHRRRFTVGRGVLRLLLGRYLGVPPEAVPFRYGPNEKPYLDPGGGLPPALEAADLQFNLSNSEDLAVVAFARGEEVGADVERLRPMPDALAISERFFSASERQALREVEEAVRKDEAPREETVAAQGAPRVATPPSAGDAGPATDAAPPNERDRAFFRCWTRKEAYLKAVGTGITVPLDRFDVTLRADDEPRVLSMDGDTARAAAWNLVHLEPGEGYLGAVAVRGGPWRLRGWRWEG